MYWLLFALFGGILLFFIYRIWSVWQTRFAHRSDDFEAAQLFELMHGEQIRNETPETPDSSVLRMPPPPIKPAAPAEAGILIPPAARKPVLDDAAQVVYLYLRTELSAFPLLTRVDIAALLPTHVTAPPRVQADFVICKKDFHPVVVILLERKAEDPMLDRAEALLRQHRLRVLRWPAEKLPSREKMRQQIFKPRAEKRSDDSAD